MKFLYYWPLALLVLIPVIIIMYLLKQRAVEQPFSSLFLWRELYRNHESDTPWEKLKKNWLMILQILTLLILILALCAPYLLSGGKNAQSVIVVIDNSGSMGMDYDNGKSRLEEAKSQAVSYIQSQSSDTAITLITASSSDATLLMSNAKDKSLAIEKIKAIEQTSQSGNLTAAVDMVRTLQLQLEEDSEAVIFTDAYVPLDNVSGYIVNLYSVVDNAYIDYVSYGYQDEELTVLAKVTNAGRDVLNTDINLYGDGTMLAIQSVSIPAGESEVVYFEGLRFTGKVLCAEINESDALEADNRSYDVIVDSETEANVLLVTEQNGYLKKAIELNSGVNLMITSDVDNIAQFETEQYDLYIFDGLTPDHLPENGSVILIGIPYPSLYASAYHTEGLMVEAQEQTITKYMEDASFGISCGYTFEVPEFAQSFLTTAEGSVGFYGIMGTQMIAALGFDIHDTQLPLTVDFPILVHNMLNECISTGMTSSSKIDCGASIQISSKLDGDAVVITAPDGTTSSLPTGTATYTDSELVGIYEVAQKVGTETISERFAVNFPNSESVVNYTEPTEGAQDGTQVSSAVSTALNLKYIIMILALILLCAEWIVYVKES